MIRQNGPYAEAAAVCEHLQPLDAELTARGITLTSRGQAWSRNCREWAYFTCYLDLAAVRKRLGLADCVEDHANTDPRSYTERGFVCSVHHDAVMGCLERSRRYPTVK